MPTLLVGYDLNRPGQNYERLWTQLKAHGTWWHHLDSTWLVKTDLTPIQLRNALRDLVDTSDNVLVIDVTGKSWAGTGFEDRAYGWLTQNM